jgi:hypothetical protein
MFVFFFVGLVVACSSKRQQRVGDVIELAKNTHIVLE